MRNRRKKEKNVEISPYYQIKCIVAGSQGVGKSSIVNLFSEKEHDDEITSTIGIGFDYKVHELENYQLVEKNIPDYYYREIENHVEQKEEKYVTVKTQIWDLAGQDRFSTVVTPYMRDTDIAFLVYDISDRYTWIHLDKWYKKIMSFSRYDSVPLIVLVGNKTDQVPFQVTSEEINKRAEKWNALSYITSCTNNNSHETISRMLYKCVEYYHELILKKKRLDMEIPFNVTKEHFFRRSRFQLDLYDEDHSLPNCGVCCLQ